jgi:hypothetical protein
VGRGQRRPRAAAAGTPVASTPVPRRLQALRGEAPATNPDPAAPGRAGLHPWRLAGGAGAARGAAQGEVRGRRGCWGFARSCKQG